MVTKGDLRRSALEQRDRLSATEIDRASSAVAGHIERWPTYLGARSVFLYRSIGSEISTDRLLEDLLRRSVVVGVPRVGPERLEPVVVTARTWYAPGPFGIPEPRGEMEDAPMRWDLVMVPGIAFDRRGHRLGYGRGYFDRFLARRMHRATVGLTYDGLVLPDLPFEPHDVQVDWLAAPSGVRATEP